MHQSNTQPFLPSSWLLVILALWCCAMLWRQEPVTLGCLQDAVDTRSNLDSADIQGRSDLLVSKVRQQALGHLEDAPKPLPKAFFVPLYQSSPYPEALFAMPLSAKLFLQVRPDMWLGFAFCSRSPPLAV